MTGSPDKIPVWQKQHGIPKANVYNYANFDTIADNEEIDIVDVVTPTGLHAEFTIRALKAGKHVICEKPMAPTVEDCTRMIEAARENKRTLQIGYRLHWDPFHLRLMDAIKEKSFGPWTSIDAANGGLMNDTNARRTWRVKKELGIAGALYDLGVYAVQAQLYSSQEPSRVPGEMGRRDIRVIRGIMAAAASGKPHDFGKFD